MKHWLVKIKKATVIIQAETATVVNGALTFCNYEPLRHVLVIAPGEWKFYGASDSEGVSLGLRFKIQEAPE